MLPYQSFQAKKHNNIYLINPTQITSTMAQIKYNNLKEANSNILTTMEFDVWVQQQMFKFIQSEMMLDLMHYHIIIMIPREMSLNNKEIEWFRTQIEFCISKINDLQYLQLTSSVSDLTEQYDEQIQQILIAKREKPKRVSSEWLKTLQ
ncbi:UNKNOWN [Stylonychia lemnae]|uniref:Uncharacterized protein n=1 Tax=Stylonychia lemnae TaxID=5949 RepID=A0A078APZ1_STYLE|nr:UNKNOWN [Stylonychia lemnae]|eukprot:CDW84405.1 UNKNOWN [Stylonychia lemnae]